jgi:hypothetical protein
MQSIRKRAMALEGSQGEVLPRLLRDADGQALRDEWVEPTFRRMES